MPDRRVVETIYRGKRYSGEWWIEDAILRLESEFGSDSRPLFGPGAPQPLKANHFALPSDRAQGLLWDILRRRDPHRPFFYWRGT